MTDLENLQQTLDAKIVENVKLRAAMQQMQTDLDAANHKLDLLRTGLCLGMAPEVDQFVAVFSNMLKLL